LKIAQSNRVILTNHTTILSLICKPLFFYRTSLTLTFQLFR